LKVRKIREKQGATIRANNLWVVGALEGGGQVREGVPARGEGAFQASVGAMLDGPVPEGKIKRKIQRKRSQKARA